ncbi:unnamed protein product [Urochloa humidicola]
MIGSTHTNGLGTTEKTFLHLTRRARSCALSLSLISWFIFGEAWGAPVEQQPADFGEEWCDACSSAELVQRAHALAACQAEQSNECSSDGRAAWQQMPASQREEGNLLELEVVAAKKGTRFGQYVVDWIQFFLCDQMLARSCFR